MKWLNFLKRTRIFQNIDRPILDKIKMKILKTNDFISERIQLQPITNAELDKAKQDIMKPVEININSVDISVFDKFGYVLETQNNQHYITLGNGNNPDFVREFRYATGCTDIIAIAYSKFKHLGENWLHITKRDYYYKFPKNDNGYQDYDIVKIYKIYGLKWEDIRTEKQLEEVYTKYGLNPVPW